MSIQNISFENVNITSGFWKEKQDLIRKTTIFSVYDRFDETGRIEAFKCAWNGGDKKPHYFWDSDVAKWIEGAAYILSKHKDKKLERYIDKIVDNIEKNQGEDGYFNIYFIVIEKDKRFTDRNCHELYCAGHLIEASIAYYKATNKRKFLDLMCKYADYIYDRFYVKKDTAFFTPGHQEIELALVKLYNITKNDKYLVLSKYFIDERGMHEEELNEQNQSHMPVRKQKEAIGHAVRAGYLYSAMADLAYLYNDEELKNACFTLFDNITNKRMFITGGVGSSANGEAFTFDYDLSNILAYTETCAAIGLVLFASRMLNLEINSKFSDTIERVIYNGFLSSISLDGKSFFYENPLEIIPYLHHRENNVSNRKLYLPPTQRREYFNCSCCPPNITRFIPSIGNLIYSKDENTIYIHQYMQNEAKFSYLGKEISLKQKTKFPQNGKVSISVTGSDVKIGIRIPYWSDKKFETKNGYAYFDLKDGEELKLDFGMPVKFVQAHPYAIFDVNRFAIMRGPIVYCLEGLDNESPLRDIRIDPKTKIKIEKHKTLNVDSIILDAWKSDCNDDTPLYTSKSIPLKKIKATLIPYYAFANRTETEMQIWTFIKK